MIISRYLGKEILQTLFALTLILVFIFSCNEFVRYLNYVASGKYAAWVLVQIVLLQIPVLLGLLLPLGLFFGIILGYGRLYTDSEMTVLFASGFSEKRLLKVTLGFSALIMVVVAVLSLWIQPMMTYRSREVLSMAKSGSIMQTILPGRFQVTNGGKQVYYVEKLSHDRSQMKHVFMAMKVLPKGAEESAEGSTKGNAKEKKASKPAADSNTWKILYAQKAYQETNQETGDDYLVMAHGHWYQGVPGSAEYQLAKYESYGLRTTMGPVTGIGENVDTWATSRLVLLVGKSHKVAAELQWRLAAPISTIILALLALPLCRLKPRKGKFSRIIPAALVYIAYVNLIFLGREWIENGKIPAWLGMWWIHLIFLGLAIALIYCQRFKSRNLLNWIRGVFNTHENTA